MTLNFKKFLRNQVLKQMRIQHWDANVQVFKRDELPDFVQQRIQKIFGENSLEDADWLVFASAPGITKKTAETTIFKIFNKALGEAANNMIPEEIKVFEFEDRAAPAPAETSDSVDRLTDPEAEAANQDAAAGALEGGLYETVESPEPGERFAFLKVTMK